MNIQKLITEPFANGRTRKASTWRAEDSVENGDNVRRIYHHSTLMVVVTNGNFEQVSEGWGSVTDKQGMAKLRRAA